MQRLSTSLLLLVVSCAAFASSAQQATVSMPVASAVASPSSAIPAQQIPPTRPSTTVTTSAATVGPEKPVDAWARGLSLLSLVGGIVGFSYQEWKRRRDRRNSIDDDFWFRKIISPASIEPMAKVLFELLQGIPDQSALQPEQKAFAQKVTVEMAKIYASLQILNLSDDSLALRVIDKLSLCEDALTEYCVGLAAQPPVIDPDVRTKVLEGMTQALRIIKDWHLQRK